MLQLVSAIKQLSSFTGKRLQRRSSLQFIIFSREPQLYKRVSPSVCWFVGPLLMLLSAGRDEPADNLFRVYELVKVNVS